jgi:hypothetical protein
MWRQLHLKLGPAKKSVVWFGIMDEKCSPHCIIHRRLTKSNRYAAHVGSSKVDETVHGGDRTVHPNNQGEMGMHFDWRNRFWKTEDIIRYLSAESELASREWLRMQRGHSYGVGIFRNYQNRAKFGEMQLWARGLQ